MSITIQCPECGKGYRVGDDKAGKRMKCRECGAVVPIPAGDDEFGADDLGDDDFGDLADDQPGRSRSGSRASKTSKGGRSKKKSKSKEKSSGFTSPIQLAGAAGILALSAGIVVFILFQRGILGGNPKKEKEAETKTEDDDRTAKPNARYAEFRQPRSKPDTRIPSRQSVKPAAKITTRPMPASASDIVILQSTTLRRSYPPIRSRDRNYAYRLDVIKNGKAVASRVVPLQTDGQGKGNNPRITDAPIEVVRQAVFERNLRMIGLATALHEAERRYYPKLSLDRKGLSWRVHILPFLHQQALYDQFKLNEAWDSEHNKKLIPKMPEIYATHGTANEGKSRVHVFVGFGTIFGGPAPPPDSYEYKIDYRILPGSFDPAATYVFKFVTSLFPEWSKTRSYSPDTVHQGSRQSVAGENKLRLAIQRKQVLQLPAHSPSPRYRRRNRTGPAAIPISPKY